MTAIKMTIHAITLDPQSNSPILILKEEGGERTLPIWIGLLEATAIATEMEKLEFARPMTHDLAVNLLKAAGIRLVRIDVTELKDNTYYAEITLDTGDKVVRVDSRPSDAVALALRAGADIFVNEEVLKSSTRVEPQPTVVTGDASEKDEDKWNKILEELDPSAFKYKM